MRQITLWVRFGKNGVEGFSTMRPVPSFGHLGIPNAKGETNGPMNKADQHNRRIV